jgi:hypothetical protein
MGKFMKITSIEEPRDDFFYWGEMLLSDFNDIDKYLDDAKQLFKNIMSLKEIDSGFEYLSKEQILFLSTFWQHILQVKNSGEKDSFIKNWLTFSRYIMNLTRPANKRTCL